MKRTWPPRKAARRGTTTTSDPGQVNGYRSGLEDRVAAELAAQGVKAAYEDPDRRIPYTKPAKPSRYTPDFILPNGIVVETKGRFLTVDRQKHVLIKQQHPDIDLRFVFSRSATPINKKSKTTYAAWCRKHGFLFADKSVPVGWLKEPKNESSLRALRALQEAD